MGCLFVLEPQLHARWEHFAFSLDFQLACSTVAVHNKTVNPPLLLPPFPHSGNNSCQLLSGFSLASESLEKSSVGECESCLQPGGRTLCSILSRTQAVWCWIFNLLFIVVFMLRWRHSLTRHTVRWVTLALFSDQALRFKVTMRNDEVGTVPSAFPPKLARPWVQLFWIF